MLHSIQAASSLALTLALIAPSEPAALPAGVFLEARNAAVFAGACHYNAELLNSGDKALAAWCFESGAWEGVALAGTKAVLALDADLNLVLEGARRRSVLYLDASAGEAQRNALSALFRARYAELLGEQVAVRSVTIELEVSEDGYRLAIPGVATLTGLAMPDRACCSMPESVWYRPLLEEDEGSLTSGVLVGCSETLSYHDALREERPREAGDRAAPRWSRHGENNSFLGRFRLEAD